MKIQFIEEVTVQTTTFKKDDVLEENENIQIADLNEKYVMIIFKGLRYDILKSKVNVID